MLIFYDYLININFTLVILTQFLFSFIATLYILSGYEITLSAGWGIIKLTDNPEECYGSPMPGSIQIPHF